MNKIKRWGYLVCAVILSILNVFANYATDKAPFSIMAESAYFVDQNTGRVLFSKSPHLRIEPASLVKIVTAMIVCEKVSDLNQAIVVPGVIFDAYAGLNVSSAGIKRGEIVRVCDLLAAAMVASACEASRTLAYHVGGGSVEAFVEMMNKKAKQLGAKDTYFTEPDGIKGEAYTTAYDLCLFLKEALKIPILCEMAQMVTYDMPGTNLRPQTTIYTTNKMLIRSSEYYYGRIKGFKTGTWTDFANFASYAAFGDLQVIGVVLGAKDPENGNFKGMAFPVSKSILEWIFDEFKLRRIADKGQLLNEVRVVGARGSDHVGLVVDLDVDGVLPKNTELTEITRKFLLPEYIDYDLPAGTKVGEVAFLLDDEALAKANLLSAKDVKISWVRKVFYNLAKHKKLILVVAICLFVLVWRLIYAKKVSERIGV